MSERQQEINNLLVQKRSEFLPELTIETTDTNVDLAKELIVRVDEEATANSTAQVLWNAENTVITSFDENILSVAPEHAGTWGLLVPEQGWHCHPGGVWVVRLSFIDSNGISLNHLIPG